MKNFNVPKIQGSAENQELPFEKYRRLYLQVRDDFIKKNPDLDYLEHDDSLLLAKGSAFPIIDENGYIGKSIYSNVLKTDNIDEKNGQLVKKIEEMFDNFSEIYPEIKIDSFPKKQDFAEMEKTSKFTRKKINPDLIELQTIYANTMMMLEQKILTKDEAEEIVRHYLKKYQKNKNN